MKSNKKPNPLAIVVKKPEFEDSRKMKKFHLRLRLISYPEEYFGLADVGELNAQGEQNEAYLLAEKLFEIEGVQYVQVDGYRVDVEISAAFKWWEIQRRIKAAISWYLNSKIPLYDKGSKKGA